MLPLILLFLLLITIKLFKMSNVNDTVAADVTRLKADLATIKAKLDSIAQDAGNVLTPESAKSLEDITASFDALANGLTAPAEPAPPTE